MSAACKQTGEETEFSTWYTVEGKTEGVRHRQFETSSAAEALEHLVNFFVREGFQEIMVSRVSKNVRVSKLDAVKRQMFEEDRARSMAGNTGPGMAY